MNELARVIGAAGLVVAACGGLGCGVGLDGDSAPAALRAAAAGWQVVFGADFNYDGMADVLWSNTSENRIAVWRLCGDRVIARGPAIPGPAGGGWVAVTATDFNADGMADVLWGDPATGHMAVWLMASDQVLSFGPEIPGPPGEGWRAVNGGDFNSDGMADVLWHNPTSHRMAVWLMAGVDVLAAGPELPAPSGPGWEAVNADDSNLDGMADILWYDAGTNRLAVWLMRGTEVLSMGPELPGPEGGGWIAVTGADFNDDGMADVLWNCAGTNRMATWLMHGTAVLSTGSEIPGPRGDGWTVVTAGDSDGNGMADVVWQNLAAGRVAVWSMRGPDLPVPGPSVPAPGVAGAGQN